MGLKSGLSNSDLRKVDVSPYGNSLNVLIPRALKVLILLKMPYLFFDP